MSAGLMLFNDALKDFAEDSSGILLATRRKPLFTTEAEGNGRPLKTLICRLTVIKEIKVTVRYKFSNVPTYIFFKDEYQCYFLYPFQWEVLLGNDLLRRFNMYFELP